MGKKRIGMATHPKKRQKPEDPNVTAKFLVDTATGSGKNPAAVALGHLGGLKGGPARAAKLSVHRRKAIARKAAESRWRPKINGK